MSVGAPAEMLLFDLVITLLAFQWSLSNLNFVFIQSLTSSSTFLSIQSHGWIVVRNLPQATCVPAYFAETLGKEIQVFEFSTVIPICSVQTFSLDQVDVVSQAARRGLW